MDINFLLWLQELRESCPGIVQAFFSFLGSKAAVGVLLAIPCYVYWCHDKRRGVLALLSYGVSALFNQLLKNTFCVYRPWVRDARLTPDSVAVKGATGYSFPSGHSQGVASAVAGVGLAYRDRSRWPLVVTVLITLLIGFSRNVLGVHTPQDVLVGMAEGVLFFFLIERLLAWAEAGEGRDLRLVVLSLVLAALFLAYVTFKPYPYDYQDGKLVVDPVEMTVDCYKSAGVFLAVVLGWFVERRWVHFETGSCTVPQMVARMVFGLACLGIVMLVAGKLFTALFGASWGSLLKYLCSFFVSAALSPALFGRLDDWVAGLPLGK